MYEWHWSNTLLCITLIPILCLLLVYIVQAIHPGECGLTGPQSQRYWGSGPTAGLTAAEELTRHLLAYSTSPRRPHQLVWIHVLIEYISSQHASLHFSNVTLNGKLLSLDSDDLPTFKPLSLEPSDAISLPSRSFGFIVFKEANAFACSNLSSK